MRRKNDNRPGRMLPTWAVMLIVVAVFDIFLTVEYFCIVKSPSPVGTFCGLLIAVNLLIWGILSVSFSGRKSDATIISEKELSNAMRLLRYATAILSFLSLMTTANGMKSFVFDTDWKAYLGSFAVQSILVVFSLLLCHFYVMIGTIPHFGKAGKALLLGALTLFFAVALVVSSCFSYVYISGNAYKDTWRGDSETLIQEYLIRETTELKERNTLLGKLFLENIGDNIQKTLQGDIKNYLEQKESEVTEGISHLHMEEYPSEQDDLRTIDITDTVERLRNDRNSRPEQLEVIQSSYNAIGRDVMQRAFKDYADIVQKVSDLVNNDRDSAENRLEGMSKELEKISMKLQEIINALDHAITDVDGLETIFYVKDIIPIKLTFASTATRFKEFVQGQKHDLDELVDKSYAASNAVADSGEISITDHVEAIRQQIYLLDTKQSDLNSAIRNVVKSLSELLDRLSKSDAVTTESVASLTSLTERINEYGKSLALLNDIREFMDDDLGKMYSFAGNEIVTEDEWRLIRDDDFREFLSMLHDLPDPLFLEDTYRNKYAQKGYRNVADVIKEAEILRRDLLGNLTTFEEALNYFRYDFRKMAIFSAFMAVFLDLGAFLTGCFLYSARHFQLGKTGEIPEEAETEPEREPEPEP